MLCHSSLVEWAAERESAAGVSEEMQPSLSVHEETAAAAAAAAEGVAVCCFAIEFGIEVQTNRMNYYHYYWAQAFVVTVDAREMMAVSYYFWPAVRLKYWSPH